MDAAVEDGCYLVTMRSIGRINDEVAITEATQCPVLLKSVISCNPRSKSKALLAPCIAEKLRPREAELAEMAQNLNGTLGVGPAAASGPLVLPIVKHLSEMLCAKYNFQPTLKFNFPDSQKCL